MAKNEHSQQASIAAALTRELQRQGIAGADTDALAMAVADALRATPPAAEGKRPEDLNSTNDD